jgi:hypothetical protein
MLPVKTSGWMVNLAMRRVEPVTAEESPFNTGTYGKYRAPKRTWMLHAESVHATRLDALKWLQKRMCDRHRGMVEALRKYRDELSAVDTAVLIEQRSQERHTGPTSWLP